MKLRPTVSVAPGVEVGAELFDAQVLLWSGSQMVGGERVLRARVDSLDGV